MSAKIYELFNGVGIMNVTVRQYTKMWMMGQYPSFEAMLIDLVVALCEEKQKAQYDWAGNLIISKKESE